jgi:hypothetical protein
MATPFAEIMRRVVEDTPGAIGGSFAASDGEMVDYFAPGPADEWAILTAHYGVVMQHLQSAFGTWHFGGAEYFIAQHETLDILVFSVADGYFALLAVTTPKTAFNPPLGLALAHLRSATEQLRREMA